jgi:hypothetical protein
VHYTCERTIMCCTEAAGFKAAGAMYLCCSCFSSVHPYTSGICRNKFSTHMFKAMHCTRHACTTEESCKPTNYVRAPTVPVKCLLDSFTQCFITKPSTTLQLTNHPMHLTISLFAAYLGYCSHHYSLLLLPLPWMPASHPLDSTPRHAQKS